MKRTELKRGKPLDRGKGLKRGGRLKATNPERKAEKYDRNFAGPDGTDHGAYVRTLPCAARRWSGECTGDPVAAHVVARGMGGAKGGWADLANLCTGHHDEAGERGTSQREAFEAKYGLNLRQVADDAAAIKIADLAQAWLASPVDVTGYDEDALRGWVRRRMAQYVVGAASADIPWTADDAGKSDMAGWIALDLFDSDDEESQAKARKICDGAGWST